MIERALRMLAIALAVVALLDPAMTSQRSDRPIIALVDTHLASHIARADGDAAHRALVANTRRLLQRDFVVVSAPFANASGTVLVGDQLPPHISHLAQPWFVIPSDSLSPALRIASIDAPRRALLGAGVTVVVRVHARSAQGRTVRIAMRHGGLLTDRAEHVVTDDDDRFNISLTFNPTDSGTAAITVTAKLDAMNADSAMASAVVAVSADPWRVLVYDVRPSWMSTFVRRALERDRRFAVSSRIVTSRNISTDAGRPPTSFDDETTIDGYDAIIIGAPDALRARDVDGIGRYLRERGGSVLLVFDRASTGAYTRLTGDLRWTTSTSATPRVVVATGDDGRTDRLGAARVLTDSVSLRVSEFATTNASESAASQAPALLRPSAADPDSVRAAVWRLSVGAGQLIVSGALDAWRYREPGVSGFDRFWQMQVARAAGAAPPPIVIETVSRPVAPNEEVELVVTVREAALSSRATGGVVRALVSAGISSPESAVGQSIRLWPDGAVGRFRGAFRAPTGDGAYFLRVVADGARATSPIVVSTGARTSALDDREVLSAWAIASSGNVVAATQLQELPNIVKRAIQPAARTIIWHPMRSAWWIVPFALLLGAEWWLRRRTGRA